jgi:hypothetical protein
MDNWYDMLKDAMGKDGEDFEEFVGTLDEEKMAKLKTGFNSLGGGAPFTVWGHKWVYFPLRDDRYAYVGHAPRFPCDIAMEHQ